jgi:hypothetical protein
MLALFRIVEPCGGAIVIDGLDTATMGLTDLRSRCAAWILLQHVTGPCDIYSFCPGCISTEHLHEQMINSLAGLLRRNIKPVGVQMDAHVTNSAWCPAADRPLALLHSASVKISSSFLIQ